MALFWHNLFATSQSKVQNAVLMAQQIGLFRQYALGNFRDLLKAVTHNPAMLIWLDGNTNRKGAANENYGREVMELFALGVGNYTEKDVKELARPSPAGISMAIIPSSTRHNSMTAKRRSSARPGISIPMPPSISFSISRRHRSIWREEYSRFRSS